MNFPENPASQAAPTVLVRRGGEVVDELPERAGVRPGSGSERGELGDGGCALDADAVTPPFRVVKKPGGRPVSPAQAVEGPAYGVGVRLTHQLADQLPLPAQRAAGTYAAGFEHGLPEWLVERQGLELGRAEPDQRLAEILQRQVLTLARALARLVRVSCSHRGIVSWRAPRSGSAGNDERSTNEAVID